MNVYFVFDDGTLVTPPVSGTILEGVTRDAILTIAGEHGHATSQRPIDIDEWRSGVASGRITEVFACGTAAVVTPLGRLAWRGGELTMGDGHTGKVTQDIRDSLLAIQYGTPPTPTAGCTRSAERCPASSRQCLDAQESVLVITMRRLELPVRRRSRRRPVAIRRRDRGSKPGHLVAVRCARGDLQQHRRWEDLAKRTRRQSRRRRRANDPGIRSVRHERARIRLRATARPTKPYIHRSRGRRTNTAPMTQARTGKPFPLTPDTVRDLALQRPVLIGLARHR